jgi:hypothetical protein
VVNEGDPSGNGLVKYQLASSVPANWIPYIPAHTGDNKREIQLRRAALLGTTENNRQIVIQGRSILLRHTGISHRINEEAVSRTGTAIRLCVQRARWIDGSTHVWLGQKTGLGRGEGSSGLKFDYL